MFACKLRNTEKIHGISINGIEVKISQYADDTSIFATDTESAEETVRLLHKFREVSGLSLNLEKSDFVWLGAKRRSNEVIPGVQKKRLLLFSVINDEIFPRK